MNRPKLYEVTARDVFKDIDDDLLAFESAIIALKTRFQPTDDLDALVNQLSTGITYSSRLSHKDNGVASDARMENYTITDIAPKGIVTLKPYRTFLEVEQPTSEFLVRISEEGIRFIEADGGMWRLAASKSIAGFLSVPLAEAIEEGRVVILL